MDFCNFVMDFGRLLQFRFELDWSYFTFFQANEHQEREKANALRSSCKKLLQFQCTLKNTFTGLSDAVERTIL